MLGKDRTNLPLEKLDRCNVFINVILSRSAFRRGHADDSDGGADANDGKGVAEARHDASPFRWERDSRRVATKTGNNDVDRQGEDLIVTQNQAVRTAISGGENQLRIRPAEGSRPNSVIIARSLIAAGIVASIADRGVLGVSSPGSIFFSGH
jgi:hypothetical protein